MKIHTTLALATAAALILPACGGDSNREDVGIVAQVRALINDTPETTEPSQALFDNAVAGTPETGEPNAL